MNNSFNNNNNNEEPVVDHSNIVNQQLQTLYKEIKEHYIYISKQSSFKLLCEVFPSISDYLFDSLKVQKDILFYNQVSKLPKEEQEKFKSNFKYLSSELLANENYNSIYPRFELSNSNSKVNSLLNSSFNRNNSSPYKSLPPKVLSTNNNSSNNNVNNDDGSLNNTLNNSINNSINNSGINDSGNNSDSGDINSVQKTSINNNSINKVSGKTTVKTAKATTTTSTPSKNNRFNEDEIFNDEEDSFLSSRYKINIINSEKITNSKNHIRNNGKNNNSIDKVYIDCDSDSTDEDVNNSNSNINSNSNKVYIDCDSDDTDEDDNKNTSVKYISYISPNKKKIEESTNKVIFPPLKIPESSIPFRNTIATSGKSTTIKSSIKNNNNHSNSHNHHNNHNIHNHHNNSNKNIDYNNGLDNIKNNRHKTFQSIYFNDSEENKPKDKISMYKSYYGISNYVEIENEKATPLVTNHKLENLIRIDLPFNREYKNGIPVVEGFGTPSSKDRDIINTRQKRAEEENIMLVGKWPINFEHISQTFCVKGNSNTKYQVLIDDIFECSCEDFKRPAQGNGYCKHIAFVLIRVLGVPSGCPYSYQRHSSKFERYLLLLEQKIELFSNLAYRLDKPKVTIAIYDHVPLPPTLEHEDGFELINDIDNNPNLIKKRKNVRSTQSLPTINVPPPFAKGYVKKRAVSEISSSKKLKHTHD